MKAVLAALSSKRKWREWTSVGLNQCGLTKDRHSEQNASSRMLHEKLNERIIDNEDRLT
jgi:hypothetical protein